MQGLTEGDQWRLDLFEGDQYSRVKVWSRLLEDSGNEGDEAEAETYVWVDEETALEEGEWDFEVFRREKMGRWVGGSEEYEGELRPSITSASFSRGVRKALTGVVEVDEAVRAKDPTGGRGVNGHIGGQLEAKKEELEKVLESAI